MRKEEIERIPCLVEVSNVFLTSYICWNFPILFIKYLLYFSTEYYINYFRYIGLKNRIRVLSFWNIIWLFRKFCVLNWDQALFEFCEKNQTLFELWFYWIWSFDIDWNKIESEKNLNHLTMLWTPPMGVNVGTETSFFWGLPPAYVWFWA